MKTTHQDSEIWDIEPLLKDPYADLWYTKIMHLHPFTPEGKLRLHHNYKALTENC